MFVHLKPLIAGPEHNISNLRQFPESIKRFYENWSSVKNALWKLVLLQNVLGKFVRKFSDRLFWQNNDQCRHFIATVDSNPMSLWWMRWQSHAHIADDHPISLTIFILLINSRIGHKDQQSPHDRVNLKYMVIFLTPLVHTDILLANIASTPHNPTLSRYLTWLGDFNLIHQISIPIFRHTLCKLFPLFAVLTRSTFGINFVQSWIWTLFCFCKGVNKRSVIAFALRWNSPSTDA